MKPRVLLRMSVLFFLFLFFGFTASPAEFYVSPSGNDSGPGTREKPFASVRQALKAAEAVFQKDGNENCTVWLEGGTYLISEPLTLRSNQLVNQEGNLTIRALPGENPVISGGKPVTGWKKQPDGLWKASLPEDLNSDREVRELFIGSHRAIRARHPNEGYLRVRKVGDDRRTHFFFGEGDFPLPAAGEKPELILLHDWSVSRIEVKEIDPTLNRLTAVDSIGAKSPAFFNLDHWEKDPRYFLENSIEFLDADYEWIADEGEVILKLPGNIHPLDLEIVIPVSEGLVMMTGTARQPLKNVRFEGVAFRHSAWQIPAMGYCGVQACHFDPRPEEMGWSVVPPAIKAVWTENCLFTRCSFEQLGGSGLWFSTGCIDCSVKDSRFLDISGNGIMIGEGRDREVDGEKWWQVAPGQVALGNSIENCIVEKCGQQFFGAVGIWCGLTAETSIRNNEVSQMPYTGVSIGWMWSPVPTPCRANVVDGNHIHHIMQILSDGGGIYMLGLQPGSKLMNNHIHDVHINAGRAESNGMFLDEGTTDVVIAGNLIYNIAKSPLRFHKATTNLVKDNALFCGEGIPPIRYNNTKEEDIKKTGNQIFSETDDDYRRKLNEMILQWKEQNKGTL